MAASFSGHLSQQCILIDLLSLFRGRKRVISSSILLPRCPQPPGQVRLKPGAGNLALPLGSRGSVLEPPALPPRVCVSRKLGLDSSPPYSHRSNARSNVTDGNELQTQDRGTPLSTPGTVRGGTVCWTPAVSAGAARRPRIVTCVCCLVYLVPLS